MAYDPLKPPSLDNKPPTYNPTEAVASTYKPVTQQVGDNSLVAKQVTGLLSKSSPYMKQAETTGLKAANRRGLLNSLMAVGAVEGERIKAALPIAQQDAATFGNQDLTNQQFTNDAGKFNASTKTDVSLNNAAAQNRAGEFNASTQAQFDLAEFGEEGVNYRANLENDLRRYVADLENSVGNKDGFLKFANENNQQFTMQISEIMRSPDIDPDTKNTMIQDLQAIYKTNFDLAAKVADYPIEWVPISVDVKSNTTKGKEVAVDLASRDANGVPLPIGPDGQPYDPTQVG